MSHNAQSTPLNAEIVRPKSLVCCFSGGIGMCTQYPCTDRIFISPLDFPLRNEIKRIPDLRKGLHKATSIDVSKEFPYMG